MALVNILTLIFSFLTFATLILMLYSLIYITNKKKNVSNFKDGKGKKLPFK